MDPEAVQDQPLGQRMDLGRADLQALAGQGPGQLVEDAGGHRLGRPHGHLQRGRVGLVAGRRPHAAGLQVVQQAQVGGRLLGRRGAEVTGGQGVDVPRIPGLVGLAAEAGADLVPLALEEVIGRRGGAVAGKLLHGPMVKVGQHLRLPAVPDVGADRAQVGGGEHVEHLQQLGRADLHGETDDQVLVAGVAAEGQVVHPQVLVDEELDGLRLVRLQAQPPAGLLGDLQADLAVVFQQPLAQVVDQQGQVQEVLVLQPAIDAPHRPRVVQQPLGELDRADAMLIDRVLVILVELQQAAGTGEIGQKPLQDRHVVQVAEQRAQAAGMGQQGKEMPAGLRAAGVAASGPPRGGSLPR